jgi:hypothetical protein
MCLGSIRPIKLILGGDGLAGLFFGLWKLCLFPLAETVTVSYLRGGK